MKLNYMKLRFVCPSHIMGLLSAIGFWSSEFAMLFWDELWAQAAKEIDMRQLSGNGKFARQRTTTDGESGNGFTRGE